MKRYDFSLILASKKAYRKKLAQMPIGEKLLLIERMRQRDSAIARSRSRWAKEYQEPEDGAKEEG